MRSADISGRFTRFFTERGHTAAPSASLIADDPTLLLVNAGMVPFKPYFLGQEPPPYPRAVSIQKCVRTADIDIVGTNSRNTSFFQMAGNFSFGDYFKEGAIPFAWELLTKSTGDGGFGFDESRLWPTVYLDDDEAYRIWTKDVGVPEARVQRRDREDNFWSMGVAGPCGPCSEIYFDRGSDYGREGGPIADEERYLEVWNLVFMQYIRGEGEGYGYVDHLLGELPKRNIDTGMGVDRMAVLLQGVEDIFETDLLRPLLDWASEISGTAYGVAEETNIRLRVVADHARTSTMLVADGVVPGNEGRGYVLRRILRRTIRALRLLGVDRPVMAELTSLACDVLGPSFPALAESTDRIQTVFAQEEDLFLSTLRAGSTLFEKLTRDVRAAGQTAVSGEAAFLLHDTHGFPIDLVTEMAREEGLTVDEPEFRRLMAEQQSRAKRDSIERKSGGHADLSIYRGLLENGGATTFTGYDETDAEGSLSGLLVNGASAVSAGEGVDVEVVLDRSPFYAEGGGQLADHGKLELANGTVIEIYDAQRPIGDLIVHRGRVVSGEATVGVAVHSVVDVDRRKAVSRAHTATHLVHQAIRRALGEHASQAGSQNDAGRFRFDFASPSAVPDSVLSDIEAEVNDVLLADLDVHAFVTSQDEAMRLGAIAMFGEKYGAEVRVVEVGDYSRELCGGTHASRSSQLGVIKLLGEASIGAGKRRVEGIVGSDAYSFLAREHLLVSQLAGLLNVNSEDVYERVNAVVTRVRDLEKELEKVRGAAVLSGAGELAAKATKAGEAAVVATRVPDGTSADDLRKLALDVRGRLDAAAPAIVAAASVADGRAVVVIAVNEAARDKGLRAGDLAKGVAGQLGGGGGGRDDVAQGGGTDVAKLDEVLSGLAGEVTGRLA